MKHLILGLILSASAASAAPTQTTLLAEDFESAVSGQLPSGWTSQLPSITSVSPSGCTGFGNLSAVVQGAGQPPMGTAIASPLFAPTRNGRVGVDVKIEGTNWRFDLTVRDGNGLPNSIVRFSPDTSIQVYRSVGTAMFSFGSTSGSWTPGTATRIEVDYQSGALLQDGVVISSTSDLARPSFNSQGSVQVTFSVAGGSSGAATAFVDNIRFEVCDPVVSICPGEPNSVSATGAEMYFTGSAFVDSGDVDFTIFGLPPHTPLLLFHGGGTGAAPLGDGILCIAPGSQGLFRGAVTVSGGNNPPFMPSAEATLVADLTSPLYAMGAGALLSGTTWNFQAAYRDSTTFGAGFNFTSALSITFCQ